MFKISKHIGIAMLSLIAWSVASAADAGTQSALEDISREQMVLSNLSAMPLAFTENQGQFGDRTLFKASSFGATFYFRPDEAAYLFVRDTDELSENDLDSPQGMADKVDPAARRGYKKESMLLKAQFVGANPDAEVTGTDRLPHNNNYFYGNNPSEWHTDVPNYSSIMYSDIYPGIDLTYYGDGRAIKYDFIVNPGADISQIRIRYEGVEDLSVTSAGDLQAQTAFGLIHEKAPYIYQQINGVRRQIAGRYEIIEPGLFTFALDNGFNNSYPLIIDPELIYSTYLGGNGDDTGYGIAVDTGGNAYITGITASTDFPTVNPYQTDQPDDDVFVTKLAPGGGSLVYSTYLGGSGGETAYSIAVDSGGNAYVTGFTASSNFPTVNPYQTDQASFDVFVTKLAPDGDSLVYSTYLGGNSNDRGFGLAVDAGGNAYITGHTHSTDFPTVNPYQTDQPNADVFAIKLAPGGDSLVYSTYLGGSFEDWGYSIAVDSGGNAYVTGYTPSTDFPTVDPYQTYEAGEDVFVTILAPGGDSLVYSTYLGGSSNEKGHGIAVDAGGNAYVTGYTASTDFPTVNPYQTDQPDDDVFVTKLAPGGGSLVYSTYLGGDGSDNGNSIAVDADGNAYITGYTASTDFPTVNPYQTDTTGYDVFVTKLAPAGDSLVYSTYLGGDGGETGKSIAVDAGGNAYVTGYTASTDFPTVNPYQTDTTGYDVFVTKLAPAGDSLVYSTYLGGDANDYGNGIAVDAGGNAYVTGSTGSTDFPTVNPYQTDTTGADVFVTKLAPAGDSLVYSTYLGGDAYDEGYSIAVDAGGNAYVTGETNSTDFPTVNPYQTDTTGADVFVTKLAPAGDSLIYSTYLGGGATDYGYGIAVDAGGNAYVTGYTASTDFPTVDPYQTDQTGYDVFVTKLAPAGGSLVYSTYLGGDGDDYGYGIAVDADGNAYVTGYTASTDFPTVNPYQTAQGGYDVFVVKYGPLSGIEPELQRPEKLYLLENYPNPFNASTILTYNISIPGHARGVVKLSIYNVLGQHVAIIFEGMQEAGEHTITWDATAFPSGVYFARLETEENSESIKMVLLK